jgi:hypothetical protein
VVSDPVVDHCHHLLPRTALTHIPRLRLEDHSCPILGNIQIRIDRRLPSVEMVARSSHHHRILTRHNTDDQRRRLGAKAKILGRRPGSSLRGSPKTRVRSECLCRAYCSPLVTIRKERQDSYNGSRVCLGFPAADWVRCVAWDFDLVSTFLAANRHTKIWSVIGPSAPCTDARQADAASCPDAENTAAVKRDPDQIARRRLQAGYVSRFHLSCRIYL